MIQETYECRECGSSNIIKNGHSASGSQQYHCKDCGAHKVLDPEPRGYSEEEKEKILRAYRERGSKRAISRIFGVSRNTLNRWLGKKGREAEPVADGLQPARDSDTLELDECWTYVRRRSNKRWLWVALCRRTRQVVAFVIGDRSAKTCARLWSRIPESYRKGRSFSDFWKSYRPVFKEDPTHQQVGKSSGELAHVERFFGRLRQKLARYVRRTRAASQSERMLHLTTKLFVEWYNEAAT
ncbi:IS1 family transposase [Salinibacter ruber]|uniref:IS1 family transposase n=1 Tax=Salinibacter ruber TaxID=146919 RepID=UPI002167F963|nr:IS1 family transposase [Salinibacter ruber]